MGGFRAPVPMPTFQVESGTLRPGDTLTVVYGDRQAGSEGWLQQTFATDEAMLPIYIDLDGAGHFLTPRWPAYEVSRQHRGGRDRGRPVHREPRRAVRPLAALGG